MKFIYIKITYQYGNPVYRPACSTSQFFADMAGTKTLTAAAIKLIKAQGYEVRVEPVVATL